MPVYFIYCITCVSNCDLPSYIGSTKNIQVREQLHKSNANCNINREPYMTINANGGFNNWTINVLEIVETDSKQEVYNREQYHLDQTERKLNKRNATFNCKAYMKKWYDDNKEKLLAHKKEYYKNNREKRLEYQREYTKKKSKSNVNDSATDKKPDKNETVQSVFV